MDYTVHRILQARMLEWAAFPFSGGIFPTHNLMQVSHIAGDSLPAEPPGKTSFNLSYLICGYRDVCNTPLLYF